MKHYDSNEIKSVIWLKRQKYLHTSDVFGNRAEVGYKLIEKFPINQIKHNPATYPNQLNLSEVIYMMYEFYPSGYHPLCIDGDNNLLDGQHRLKLAEMCCIDYVDVWVVPPPEYSICKSRKSKKNSPVIL
jgi:hypothetical protein